MATIIDDVVSLQEYSVLLTDINNLNATPIDLVPAQGAGTVIYLVGGMYYLYYVSTVYGVATTIGFKFDSNSFNSWEHNSASTTKAEVWGARYVHGNNANIIINEKLQCYAEAVITGAGGDIKLTAFIVTTDI